MQRTNIVIMIVGELYKKQLIKKKLSFVTNYKKQLIKKNYQL
jgi:hypothetical protein